MNSSFLPDFFTKTVSKLVPKSQSNKYADTIHFLDKVFTMKDTIFLLIMVILSASSRTSSGTNIKGNDDVLNQLMTRLDKLTKQVEHLSKKGNVEERLENLEEIAKVKLLRSCHELEQHGVTKNGKLASSEKISILR